MGLLSVFNFLEELKTKRKIANQNINSGVITFGNNKNTYHEDAYDIYEICALCSTFNFFTKSEKSIQY